MTFHHPWFLLLLPVIAAILWRWRTASHRDAIAFPVTTPNWQPRRTWRQRLMWLPSALSILALSLMIVALARPRYGRQQTIVNSEGIAIEMVIDRSGSMQALDFRIDQQPVDRLTAVKKVAAKFVLGNQPADEGQLPGRIADLVGLIVFAGYADAMSPPTLDHTFLVEKINRVSIVDDRSEDGTAIGDAISLAVEKLGSLDERQTEKVKAKVIILLTDGENTAGQVDPDQAAELAKSKGIKIYTIGVGTKGQAPFPVDRLPNGRIRVRYLDVNIDEETLRDIASRTGGKYFRATDTTSLLAIYNEIDQLEKTKIDSQTYFDFREFAVQGGKLNGSTVPPLLLIAFWALAARLVLARTIFRRVL